MHLSATEKEQIVNGLSCMPEIKIAYLYGSYASGLANENSDIDIAVVLKEGIVPDSYLKMEIDIGLRLEDGLKNNKEVDVHIINNAPLYFLNQAVTKGVPLFASSEPARIEFESQVMMAYLDIKPVYDLYDSYRLQRIKRGEFGVKYRRRNPAVG